MCRPSHKLCVFNRSHSHLTQRLDWLRLRIDIGTGSNHRCWIKRTSWHKYCNKLMPIRLVSFSHPPESDRHCSLTNLITEWIFYDAQRSSTSMRNACIQPHILRVNQNRKCTSVCCSSWSGATIDTHFIMAFHWKCGCHSEWKISNHLHIPAFRQWVIRYDTTAFHSNRILISLLFIHSAQLLIYTGLRTESVVFAFVPGEKAIFSTGKMFVRCVKTRVHISNGDFVVLFRYFKNGTHAFISFSGYAFS